MKKIIISIFMLIFTSLSLGATTDRVTTINSEIADLEEQIKNLKNIRKKMLTLDNKLDSDTRPKIGLALSGGGAKGAAHVGVLRVLEEYGIPIDYIAGTSIGSIVGALYASGYSVDELEEIVTTLDWNSLFDDAPERDNLTAEERLLFENYFLTLKIDEDYSLVLPKGVLRGESLYLTLKDLMWRSEFIEDFDDLPIPFRAIATDLNTGNAVSIDRGNLAFAAFKSMAIPTALDPIKDEGSFYVDGGLARNLPVEDVLKMGADIVIAVDIGANSTIITEDTNIVEVIDKMSTYKGVENTKKQKQLADILIVPDVKDHGTLNFEGLDKLISLGEDATRELEDTLTKISYPNVKRNKPLEEVEYIDIKKVNIYGGDILNTDKALILKPQGEEKGLTKKDINLWMERIFALTYVDRVFYDIDGDTINIKVNETLTSEVKAGFNYNSDTGIKFDILGSTSSLGIHQVKQNTTFHIEASMYPSLSIARMATYNIKNIKFAAILEALVDYDPLHIYKGSDKISEDQEREISAGFTFATILFEKYIAGSTLKYRSIKTSYREGDRDVDIFPDRNNFLEPSLFVIADTRDHGYFPKKGFNLFADYREVSPYFNDDISFRGGSYLLENYQSLGEKLSLSIGSSGGYLGGDHIPTTEYFKVGGIWDEPLKHSFSFYGMNAMRIYTREFTTFYGGFQYELNKKTYLLGRYNILTFSDDSILNTYNCSMGRDYFYGYGLGIGSDTFIGPLELVLTNDVDNGKFLINLSFGYNF